MTDSYDAAQLERDLDATIVQYRRWLNNRDQWTGFDDDVRHARLRRLAGDVAEVVQKLTTAQEQGSEPAPGEFGGKVETEDGAGFETYAYFEEGQFIVADDDDEEWVVDLDDVIKHEGGFLFPDKDGSQVRFVPGTPDAFSEALEQAGEGLTP